ncbi:MAG: DNA repair protein RecO, partial [Thermomicrobiales bacterium]|nr:DNA repair protein RecO [Thermomicrobiales bacterium]
MSDGQRASESERQARRLYRCEAIVLSRVDFGEADRLLTVYSRQHGKLRVVAKGARRPLSRLGPHLEYFCRTQLMLARGRELDVVTGAETVNPHLPLRVNLDAYGHASHMVEVLARLTEDRQE